MTILFILKLCTHSRRGHKSYSQMKIACDMPSQLQAHVLYHYTPNKNIKIIALMIITNFCACPQAAASMFTSWACYNSWDLELFKFTQNLQTGSKFKLYNTVELCVHVFRKSTCISQMQHRKHDMILCCSESYGY